MTNARLEELRAKFQENPRRYFAPFANELRKAGDPAQAIAVCRTHLAGQPGHVSGHIVLGQSLYEAGEPDEARDVFIAALELDPENLIALRTLGEIAQVNGNFDAARQWYERLLEADPRNTEVAQLLRDIPTETPSAPIPQVPAEALEEPTPFTVRSEYEAPAPTPEVPVPMFHTSFTGSQRAVPVEEEQEPEADSGEELAETAAAESADEPFIDLEPSAHEDSISAEPSAEPVVPADESEPLEMIDVEAFAQASPDEPRVEPPEPDELLEFAGMQDVSLETGDAVESPVVGESAEFTIDVEEPTGTEVQSSDQDDVTAPEPITEHPRAVFAERGFDGPTKDEVDWMTTPSAAFSDLEAAPETWFDEQSVDALEVDAEQPTTDEPPVEEPATTPDYASDSWFDEVPGATTIEATEVTSGELWLPPEMPHVSQAEDNSLRDREAETRAPESDEREPDWSSPVPVETGGAEPPVELESAGAEPVAEASAVPPEDYGDSQSTPQAAPAPQVEEIDQPAAWAEAAIEPDTADWAGATTELDVSEPARIDVEALTEVGEEAVVVEHPVPSPVAEAGSEAKPSMPDEDRLEEPVSAAEANAVPESGSATAAISPAAEFDDSEAAFADVPPDDVPPVPEVIMGRTPVSAEAVSTPTTVPFITETLAELYLQQGFRDEALSIYRQLSERDPDNESFRNRIAALEEGEASVKQAPRAASASQSVRTFFSRIARRPAMTGGASSTAATPRPDEASDSRVPFAAAASASALANLFSASRPPASDEGAASTLAGAFTDPAGRTNRGAEQELSLDHLFRDVPAGGSPGGGVTLDEFYSTPHAETGSPTESGEGGGSEEPGGADIRQFTAWLEGLRKK